MIYLIPTSTKASNYEQTVSLDGTDYRIRLLWNGRDTHWYMTLRTAAGVDLVTGIKVVANIPFAVHVADSDMPAGQIWVLDTTGGGADPGLRDLGERVVLLYADEESAT